MDFDGFITFSFKSSRWHDDVVNRKREWKFVGHILVQLVHFGDNHFAIRRSRFTDSTLRRRQQYVFDLINACFCTERRFRNRERTKRAGAHICTHTRM